MSQINWTAVEQWRNALRSGKYKQGVSQLRNLNNEYCCLGVFCEAVVGIEAKLDSFDDSYYYKGASVYLPRQARTKLGVSHEMPFIFGVGFATLNDMAKHTFDEIADLLDIALIEREGIA